MVVITVFALLPIFGKTPAEIEAYGKRLQDAGKAITGLFFAVLLLFLVYLFGSALWGG